MRSCKQAGEAFGALSYWDTAGWEDFICNGRNCFCISCPSGEFAQRKGDEEKGNGDFSCSLLLCLPPTSEDAFAVRTVMEMQLQPDIVSLE